MSEASTKLNIKNITYALFFLGTLLICFIQSGYLTLTALRHMILEFGRNLTFFARKLGVNLIFFSGIYLNPEKDLVIWLMVKKNQTRKNYLKWKFYCPCLLSIWTNWMKTTPYLLSLLSRDHCLHRENVNDSLWSCAVLSAVLLPSPIPILLHCFSNQTHGSDYPALCCKLACGLLDSAAPCSFKTSLHMHIAKIAHEIIHRDC